jgi:cytochrome c-type biogenesis protein
MSDLFWALTKAVEGAGWLAIPAALVWGILSIVLSPCHLTSVPLVIGYINRGQAPSARRGVWTATFFAVGVLVTLAMVGGLALAAGRLMGQTGIWGNIVVAMVLLAVGLYLLGLLRLPAGLTSPEVHPRRDALGALILGLVMGLALGPCAFAYLAPVLAVVFGMSGLSLTVGAGMLLAFAIGHSAVILLMGAFAGLLGKVLSWNERSKAALVLRKVCGALLVVGAAYLIYRTF